MSEFEFEYEYDKYECNAVSPFSSGCDLFSTCESALGLTRFRLLLLYHAPTSSDNFGAIGIMTISLHLELKLVPAMAGKYCMACASEVRLRGKGGMLIGRC
jgi:hypothetical protein